MNLMLLTSLAGFILLTYLAWGGLYQLVFSLAGHFFHRSNTQSVVGALPFIRVFIPAYREDAVVLNTVRKALVQDYPADCYEVVVIADGLRPDTLTTLSGMPVVTIPVVFEKSTKAKALNAALAAFDEAGYPADMAVVLDADNIMAPGFLAAVARRYQAGVAAIQGQRLAKNNQTSLAVLDAASEAANTHILCRGHRVLGFSARLAGSGMAFDYTLFQQTMQTIDAVGGFDKAMELALTRAGVTIEYAENAGVLDEKVSRADAFATQRSRWISAQFRYARRTLPLAFETFIRRGNVDFLVKSLQMTLPPRLLGPGVAAIGLGVALLVGSGQATAWAIVLGMHVAALAIALPKWFYTPASLKSLLYLPLAFGATLVAMTRLKQAGKVFVVTPKVVVTN